jgi:hypothetical protein
VSLPSVSRRHQALAEARDAEYAEATIAYTLADERLTDAIGAEERARRAHKAIDPAVPGHRDRWETWLAAREHLNTARADHAEAVRRFTRAEAAAA